MFGPNRNEPVPRGHVVFVRRDDRVKRGLEFTEATKICLEPPSSTAAPPRRAHAQSPRVRPPTTVAKLRFRLYRRFGPNFPYQVAALNGFSTIDAEVEFSRTKKPATRDGNCSPGAPTLSAATTAAAAEAAVAEARAEEEAAGADLSSEEGEADAEAPVFLTFRFRREPLSRGTAEREPEPEPDTPATGGSSGEITNLTMGDEEEEAPAVAATSNGHRGGGDGGGEVNDGCTDPLREENSVTACTPADGGKGISGSSSVGNNGGAKEGRKRAGSRGSECEGKGGGDKGSKRAKSAGGAGGAAEKDDEEVEEEEEDGDGEEEQARQCTVPRTLTRRLSGTASPRCYFVLCCRTQTSVALYKSRPLAACKRHSDHLFEVQHLQRGDVGLQELNSRFPLALVVRHVFAL